MILAVLVLLCHCVAENIQAQTVQPNWQSITDLPLPLTGHKMVTLSDGKILVCGGITSNGTITASSYIYDNGRWIPTLNQLQTSRAYHALVSVKNAQNQSIVFAIGGYRGTSSNASSSASVEVLQFNTTANGWAWQTIGSLPFSVGDCSASFNNSGAIVISGGKIQSSGAIRTGTPSNQSAIINVSSLTISSLSAMATARSEHANLLFRTASNTSSVVVAGGEVNNTPSTEILTGTTWDARANPPQFQQRSASSFTDRSEIARMVGGIDETGNPTNRGQWYDVKSGWRFMPRMQTPRAFADLTHIAGISDTSNSYIIIGGRTSANKQTAEVEIFSLPNSSSPNGSWSPLETMITPTEERTVSINSDNLPVVAGGTQSAQILSSCEQYQPLRANDLNFGQQEIGGESQRLKVRLENTWLLPVMIRSFRTSTAEFRLTNARDSIIIPANGSTEIDIRFRPNSIGVRDGELRIDIGSLTVAVKLRGEGIKSSITVVNSLVDFDKRRINTDSTICFRSIKNEGKDTTVIDSVLVDSPDVFFVVSPIGRVLLAPDSTLIVCVRFLPTLRDIFTNGVTVYIASRAYPISLKGQGIRAFITTQPNSLCDTIALAVSDSISVPIRVDNNSDLPVTISDVPITSSLAKTFVLRTPLPQVIQPRGFQIFNVMFISQRESEERATITFQNNGDSVCKTSICITPRNRKILFNAPALLSRTVCIGDTISLPLILENPSSFESLTIDSITYTGVAGTTIGLLTNTLQPRSTTVVDIKLIPQSLLTKNGAIICHTNQGTAQLAYTLNLLPRMQLGIASASASVAEIIKIEVTRDDNSNSSMQSIHDCIYNGSLLSVRRVRNIAGKNFLNEQATTVQNFYGRSELNLVWNSHPQTNETAFEIEADVLRGDDSKTDFTLQSSAKSVVCSNTSTSTIDIAGLCGGRASLVRTENVVQMMIMPQPVRDVLHLQVSSLVEGISVRLRSTLGENVLQKDITSTSEDIPLTNLASGMYICELHGKGLLYSSQPILIVR
jgi:hypothetical protein